MVCTGIQEQNIGLTCLLCTGTVQCMLAKLERISLYVTDEAIAKL